MSNWFTRVRAAVGGFFGWLSETEPARLAEGVRQLLVAGNVLGWVTIPDAKIAAVVSVVSVLASLGLTKYVRSSVWSRQTMDKVATGQHHTEV